MFQRLSSYQPLAPLLLRLGIGLTFFFAGLGKIMGGIDGVVGFFGSLGIPAPGIMAPFVAYLELIGGLALILGVLTRLFGSLFIAVMAVAIVTARLSGAMEAEGLPAAFNEIRLEVVLLLGSAALVLWGAGALSIDAAVLGDRPDAPHTSAADNTSFASRRGA
jgi:uncharacterized membrane protein YphA (DoxX/SURF4 family)